MINGLKDIEKLVGETIIQSFPFVDGKGNTIQGVEVTIEEVEE